MREKLDKVIDLMEPIGLMEEQLSHTIELRQRLSDRELIISVIGKFKSGKSSLINVLLGEELLPAGIIPMTTVVTEIRSAKSFRALVCFMNGSEEEIRRDELLDYISEQKNPDNEKKVSVVKLWITNIPFDSDITLVDTPGVGSVHLHNTETSNAYIEKSDAVLFLLSVDSPVSEIELDFLLKTRKHATKFYFAVNKIDTISKENLKEFLSYSKGVLSEATALDVKLYPLSAKTGEGVDSLKEKLDYDLQASYDDLLEASVLLKLDTIIGQAKAKLILYLKAAKIPAEELETKMAQIKEKKLSLNTLADEFQVLVESQTERLVEDIKEQLGKKLPETINVIQTKAFKLYEDLKSFPSKEFESKFTDALENVLSQEIKQLNNSGLALLDEGYGSIVDSFNKKSMDTALYISEMVMEYFDVEYPISSKTYSVSERSDYYVRLTLYERISVFVHLLPRGMANSKIYDRLLKKAINNLNENKTRIIYNYRYKMRESLRLLSVEFDDDISDMSSELNELLTHVEQGHNVQDEELRQVEAKYMLLIRQLDEVIERRDKNKV